MKTQQVFGVLVQHHQDCIVTCSFMEIARAAKCTKLEAINAINKLTEVGQIEMLRSIRNLGNGDYDNEYKIL